MIVSQVAGAVGRGLFAGAAGTVAMTVSSTLEAKLSQREGSTAPADAAGKVLGVRPVDEAGEARFATVVHWSYGTGWGVARGLLEVAGLTSARAGAAHFGAVWGLSLVMLPALGVSPPPWALGVRALATDAGHHVVYAAATSVVYGLLES